MKKLLLWFYFSVTVLWLNAQILEPVKWKYSGELTGKNTATLKFTATIDRGWYLYSQHIPDGGPIKTSFYFHNLEGFEFVDGQLPVTEEDSSIEEGKKVFRVVFHEPQAEQKEDPNFNMVLGLLKESAEFTRDIRITTAGPLEISGYLEFMCCDNEKCLPPTTIDFSFTFQVEEPAEKQAKANANTANFPSSTGESASKNVWSLFVMGLIGGLLALFTPCVFPMIPMTVSYFLRNSGSRAKGTRDGILYGVSIILIYVILGMTISLIFGSDTLNKMATSPVFNIFFFLLLLVFAASFFGAFELQLPSSWVNKMDSKAEKSGGVVGIFLMALVMVLVSFSCTGPIVGTLLVQTAVSGNWLGPLMGMAGFAIALATPFTLLAIFPSMLGNMPKSGGWLNSVKVVLAFILTALSLKFLSVADSVGQWNLLSRDLFIALWIVIFALMGFYLLGKIKFHHDDDLPYISVSRLALAILTFSFVIYLIPGLWGAPLHLVSSFLPSPTSQEFNINLSNRPQATLPENPEALSKYKTKKGVYGLTKFLDFEEGMEYARKVGKPVFLDFTGHGCANCKKMEASVWGDPQVLKKLSENFVIVSLYVDDRTALPENEQYVSELSGRKIRTVGAKWSDFQAKRYRVNSQPYYLILDHQEQQLSGPYAFNPKVDDFLKFLDEGLSAFQKDGR